MIEANKHIFAEHLLDLMRLIYAVLILLLALITSAQCQKTAKDWVDEGIALAQQGKYDEALQALDKAIEINSQNKVTWSNKGNVLWFLGKYNDSFDAYDKAIDLISDDVPPTTPSSHRVSSPL